MPNWAKFFTGDDSELPEGFEPDTPTDPDEIDNTGCQHANWKTDGMANWCEDCGLSDDA